MGAKLLEKYYEKTGVKVDFNQIILEVVTRLFDVGNNEIPRMLQC